MAVDARTTGLPRECRFKVIKPDGGSGTYEWTGSDSDETDNHLLVDEGVPNTSDYVLAGNVGDEDTYTLEDSAGDDEDIGGLGIHVLARVFEPTGAVRIEIGLVDSGIEEVQEIEVVDPGSEDYQYVHGFTSYRVGTAQTLYTGADVDATLARIRLTVI
jgi:hypothetical protein